MAITEQRRNALHNDLANTIGPESAETLMEMLPPTGWADVATKRDVDDLASKTNAQFASLRDWLDAKFDAAVTQKDLRQTIFAVLAFNVALVGAVVGAVAGLT